MAKWKEVKVWLASSPSLTQLQTAVVHLGVTIPAGKEKDYLVLQREIKAFLDTKADNDVSTWTPPKHNGNGKTTGTTNGWACKCGTKNPKSDDYCGNCGRRKPKEKKDNGEKRKSEFWRGFNGQ